VTPNFYFIFEASKSLSVRGRSLKKIYRVENFRANVLKKLAFRALAPRQSELQRANARNVSFLTRYGGQFTIST